MQVLSYTLFQPEPGADTAGVVTLQLEDGTQTTNAIWYDEDGEHYFRYPSGEVNEAGEPILEVALISDYTSTLTPVTCAHCEESFAQVDTIEGLCLECALDEIRRKEGAKL
jgi:hypothetical protein